MTGILLDEAKAHRYNAQRVRKKSKRDMYRAVFYVLAGIGIVALALSFCTADTDEELVNIYKADQPKAQLPEQVIPYLIPLTPLQLADIPVADGFQFPVGPPNMAFMYDAQGFGEHNEKRGGYHSGCDFNGIGGGNTDEGEPVYSAARGKVVFCKDLKGGWGKVVILAHRLEEGTNPQIYQTIYAHLKDCHVNIGDTVCRGEQIGSIGTANGQYLAHLHFEICPSQVTEAGLTAYHPQGTMNRVDPQKFINAHPAPPIPDPMWQIYSYYQQSKLNNPATR